MIVRDFGPEIEASITIAPGSILLQYARTGEVLVAGRLLKAEGPDLEIGLDLVVVATSPDGTALDRRTLWTQLRRAGDEHRFEVWLDPRGHFVAEVHLAFEENGPIVVCSDCGGMIDLREDMVCLDCAYQALVRRMKRGRP